jgi:hypothetical protein
MRIIGPESGRFAVNRTWKTKKNPTGFYLGLGFGQRG